MSNSTKSNWKFDIVFTIQSVAKYNMSDSIIYNVCKPVAKAIKFSQACNYTSVNTGLFLKSLVATNIVEFIKLMLVINF